MRNKLGVVVGIGIAAFVLVTLGFYVLNAGTIDFSDITAIGIALILVLLAAYLLWDRIRNVRKGLPAKDERMTLISYKAGYYGFIAAIWTAVGSNLIAGIIFDYELASSQNAAAVVFVSGLVFILSFIYLTRRG